MNLCYYYYHACGFEAYNVFCGYVRTSANGELYQCPECGEENFAEVDD